MPLGLRGLASLCWPLREIERWAEEEGEGLSGKQLQQGSPGSLSLTIAMTRKSGCAAAIAFVSSSVFNLYLSNKGLVGTPEIHLTNMKVYVHVFTYCTFTAASFLMCR